MQHSSRTRRRTVVAALALASLVPSAPGAVAADAPVGASEASSARPVVDQPVRIGAVHNGPAGTSSYGAAASKPANDDFLDAQDLSDPLFNDTVVSGSNAAATLESGEPQAAGAALSNSVWFRVPKGLIGQFDANTSGSSIDTVLNVWRGYSLDSLEFVTGNDDTGGKTSQVTFDLDDRRDYWLQLGSKGGSGSYKLNLGFDGRIQTAGLVSYHPGPLTNADGGVVLKGDFYVDRGEIMAEFSTAEGWQTHQVGDLDGDGTQSLYSYFPGPDGNGKGRWWQTNLDTGRLSRLTDFGTATGWQSHLMADMDGNGIDEIVSFFPGNGSWWQTQVRADGTAVQRKFTEFGTREGWQTHRVADMDGDGRDEILSYFPGNGSWWETRVRADGVAVQRKLTTYGTRTGWSEHLVGDVTGDETPELLSFHPGSGRWWQTDVSNPTARQSILTVYGEGDGLSSAAWEGHVLGDWDFDGKDDLLSFDTNTGDWWSTSTDGTSAQPRALVYSYSPTAGWQGHQFAAFG